MSDTSGIAYVIDDDASVREGLADLLQSVGLRVATFASTEALLRSRPLESPACIVLDVRLPGQSGLEFQQTMLEAGIELPVIFISGHADIPMSVQAIKSGAVEFLTKPLHDQRLLDAVQAALRRDQLRRRDADALAELRSRYDSLTPREREVFALVVTGRPNKQIAAALSLSEMTVKVHRSQLTRKMRARSVVELVRMADRLGVSRADTAAS
jgi:FixJ family two-component response regulator